MLRSCISPCCDLIFSSNFATCATRPAFCSEISVCASCCLFSVCSSLDRLFSLALMAFSLSSSFCSFSSCLAALWRSWAVLGLLCMAFCFLFCVRSWDPVRVQGSLCSVEARVVPIAGKFLVTGLVVPCRVGRGLTGVRLGV